MDIYQTFPNTLGGALIRASIAANNANLREKIGPTEITRGK